MMPGGIPLYTIRDFSRFLGDKMRGRTGACVWLKLPVKLSDVGYVTIASGPDGALTLGVWLALLEFAGSLSSRDGVLKHGCGTPYTVEEIAMVTRLPVADIRKGLRNLAARGWVVPNGSERFRTVPNGSAERKGEERRGEQSRAEVELKPDVSRVVKHYQSHHPRAKPGDKERKLIRARLGDGFSATDLIAAIDGNHRDPHCCGKNNSGTKYHALGLIMRDSSHVQRYIETTSNGDPYAGVFGKDDQP